MFFLSFLDSNSYLNFLVSQLSLNDALILFNIYPQQ
uniref:Uncharacterized protein n=1 Tax=Nelumbo nucifera TaxID=4432 RepID=A0A822XS34_NELNU|nr:TPA_asm: hypothetical protein HUJ06_021761 [Nelumbo nucifera]DAD20299.1 TPA_asm: hypothetical protein HUJ06_021762 [Nelumbo nucifera]